MSRASTPAPTGRGQVHHDPPAPVATIPGAIAANELYTMDEVKQRLSISGDVLRICRRNGLTIRRIGNTRVILGSDLIGWLQENAPQT